MSLAYFQGKVLGVNGQHWCISGAVREVIQTIQDGNNNDDKDDDGGGEGDFDSILVENESPQQAGIIALGQLLPC